MKDDRKNLDLKTPFIALVGITLLIVVIFSVLSSLDKGRKDAIYQEYASETNAYIAKNKPGLTKIFTEIFPKEACWPTDTKQCYQPSQDEINQAISHDLKDFSSIMFVKRGTTNQPLYMRLSGEYGETGTPYPEEKGNDLKQLLNGEKDMIDWEDYFYQLPGKEVVIPVKDNQGKVIGAIVRGVVGK